MRIHIPNSAWIGNIDPFLRSFDNSDPSRLDITSNERWVSVHPAVLCMISALGIRVRNSGGSINIGAVHAKSRNYFERIGLFRLLNLRSAISIKEHDPSGRFIPLTQIKDAEGRNRFIRDMIPLLHSDQKQVEPIRYVISELVSNVLEHANTNMGAVVCAQFYPKSKTIRVGVADSGIGIRGSIGRHHYAKDDANAIELALTPGISGAFGGSRGRRNYRNAGAGLFFIKSIAKVSRDFFMIYSGTALYKLLKTEQAKVKLIADPAMDKHSSRNDLPYWQGTVVGIDLTVNDTPAFTDLLARIRDFYSEERKKGKKLGYKKPRFTYG